MPYTLDFYWSYVEEIMPVILSQTGKSKKVLILDCDNTLWKGVLGEDEKENIKMSKEDNVGKIFHEAQTIIKSFGKRRYFISFM